MLTRSIRIISLFKVVTVPLQLRLFSKKYDSPINMIFVTLLNEGTSSSIRRDNLHRIHVIFNNITISLIPTYVRISE